MSDADRCSTFQKSQFANTIMYQDQNPVGILSCCIFPDTNAVIGVEVVVEQHTNAVIGVEVVVEQHTLILFLTTTLFIQ